jgi:hypothetical protein
MARLTKEERQRQAELERLAAEAEEAEFRKELPKKLSQLVDDARFEGVHVDIALKENGPCVSFYFNSREPDILSYESEKWIVEDAENRIAAIKAHRIAEAAKIDLARSAFNRLSKDEQVALREYINRIF